MNLSNAYILQKVDLPYFSIMYIQGMRRDTTRERTDVNNATQNAGGHTL